MNLRVAVLLCATVLSGREAILRDLSHRSQVLGEERNYRIFLPPDYDQEPQKRYPVIYFFHGWSGRYNLPAAAPNQNFDVGSDYGGDTISAFVGSHDVIVVRWDGYNPRTPGEKYPRPYNVSPVETDRQFPLYFPEFVDYIDRTYRTIPDRDHRATAGLSMGGFMSYWIAGKYPHMVGSASNFMGSSEFFAGPRDAPVEYRHDEMAGNYEGLYTRLVTGSRDFIRWYHRQMNSIWDALRPRHEHENFDWDHGTPGMAKTLEFHMRAFANPLPRPAVWNHADVYPSFPVWGWSVKTDRRTPGYTVLENVHASGLRSSGREWLPDGRLLPDVQIQMTSPPLFTPGTKVTVTDCADGNCTDRRISADPNGRILLVTDGRVHQVGFTAGSRPSLGISPAAITNGKWPVAGQENRMRLDLINSGSAASGPLQVSLSAADESVQVRLLNAPAKLAPHASAPVEFTLRTPGAEKRAVRLELKTAAVSPAYPVFLLLYPAPETEKVVVADGAKYLVYTQGVRVQRLDLGSGNGNGIPEPGEAFVVLKKDGGAYRSAELVGSDPCVDLRDRKSDVWGDYDHVGASAKYTNARLRPGCAQSEIHLLGRWIWPEKPEHKLVERSVVLPVRK